MRELERQPCMEIIHREASSVTVSHVTQFTSPPFPISAMAQKLADELLQMILSSPLSVPDAKFASPSRATFGGNDEVSSSSVLLVCKRWLRVATPLLYEVVVLRSSAQAQALADAFSAQPKFALHVKKIRLEGAYSALWRVFKDCLNLHTVAFTLNIYSDNPVAGLCRALSAINPTRVVLHDDCARAMNLKVTRVFSTLLDSIPTWTNLVSAILSACTRPSHSAVTRNPERVPLSLCTIPLRATRQTGEAGCGSLQISHPPEALCSAAL